MAKVDYETKMNSKSYRFFDLLYRIVVLNVLTIILSCTILGMFPAFVGAAATFKQGNIGSNVFKQYFTNIGKNFKKSFFIGLILLILYAVIGYMIYFYSKSTTEEGMKFTELFINAGFLIGMVAAIVVTLLSCHMHLIVITFKSLTVGEMFRTSLYLSFRYFLTTLLLFFFHACIIGGFLVCFLIDARILAIWMLVGITLPLFLEVKLTDAIYYKLEKLNVEAIMHASEEEEIDDEK